MSKSGEFIRLYRRKIGMSQKELGDKLGVTAQYVSNTERGEVKAPVEFVKSIIKLLPKNEVKELKKCIKEDVLYSQGKGLKI